MQFVARLDCGPQWKDFLNFAEYCNPEGVSLQERRMTCHFRILDVNFHDKQLG